MRNTISTSISSSKLITRESLLKANSELIEQLQSRLRAKRFRPQEGDSLRLGYIRAFIQALQVQNVILKDLELEDIKERLEVLETMQSGSQTKEEDNNSDFESPKNGNVSDLGDKYELEDAWS